MHTYRLMCDGEPSILLVVELLARNDGALAANRDQSRYHIVELYHTKGGFYIVGIEYISRFEGEHGHTTFFAKETLSEALAALEDFDPASWLTRCHHSLARATHDPVKLGAIAVDLFARYRIQIGEIRESLGEAKAQ